MNRGYRDLKHLSPGNETPVYRETKHFVTGKRDTFAGAGYRDLKHLLRGEVGETTAESVAVTYV